jgi:pimeloyl-ACP methyl ester carboxylesterase
MPVAAGMHYLASDPPGATGPPLVLVHGAGGRLLHWPPEVRALPGRRVLALDLPGHGRTPGPGRRSVAEYAACVAAFLDGLGERSAALVGHSMGGAVALAMALEEPERAAALVLVATGARLRVAPVVLDQTASAVTFPQAMRRLTEWSWGPGAATRIEELYAESMRETTPEVIHGDFLACDGFDVLGRLGEVRAPALVVCGTEDRLTPMRYAEHLRDHLPGATLAAIPGAGHMVMLEEPVRVATALQAFLAGLGAA